MGSSIRSMRTDEVDLYYPALAHTGNQYTFAIIADPQLGGKDEYVGNWAKHPKGDYRNYYKAIQKINRIKPAFVVILGDLISKRTIPPQYRNFVRMTKLLQVPVVLVHGNHDGHSPFNQFFNAQDELSGFCDLYYSFDVGQWHYVILPSIPDEYNPDALLNWLAEDMRANQARDTMVFTHYPYLPQGLTRLECYVQNPLSLRTAIMDEVLRYGSIKGQPLLPCPPMLLPGILVRSSLSLNMD